PDDFLLTYESENSWNDVTSYVMEDYFGLLDDGEGKKLLREKVDLGIGRFPVRTAAEAEALVTKTENYIRSAYAGAWKNVACFLGDDGDNNSHLKYADEVAEDVIKKHPEIEVRKIMWDAYPRESTSSGLRFPLAKQAIVSQMDEGALMMNYVGHAAPYSLSHEQVLRIEDFAAFTSPRVPLWVTAACDVVPFDTQKENIGETAILNTDAAAIAFYGTTRTVYANKNAVLNRAFCDAVFDADDEGRPNRLGDAVRYSKTYVASTEGNYYENKLHYVLLGDPSLRLGSVQNHVVLDSINGTAVDALPDDFTLHAGGKVHLAGHIADADGTPLPSFTGTLHVRLYDSMSTITCLNADGADEAFTYTTYDKILYNGADSVQAGRFALTCPIPIDIKYSDENGRLLFYAITNDRLIEANGYCEDFLVGGTEPDLNDTEGPDITAWLGTEDFENGGTVCATPYFVAYLEDESGINTAGNSLGHDIELIIDNDPATTYCLNEYYTGNFGDFTRGTVAFSVPELTDGPHSLLLRAWDTQNNENAITLDFNVDRSLKMHLTDLTASINPASTTTTFLLTYDRPGSECTFTIEVFDFAGRLLWTYTETGASATGLYAIPWGLVTGSGFPLGSGIYLYRARVTCGDSEEATKTQKLVIRRRF
ncbi:MAG: type IX secretion system sortase PorU, partial [Bacteroidales bacterium]|nr:type IX secretion system sortase PorU [Bacteroidales bacterium]